MNKLKTLRVKIFAKLQNKFLEKKSLALLVQISVRFSSRPIDDKLTLVQVRGWHPAALGILL